MGACARYGTSYSATIVLAAVLMASGLADFFASVPGFLASSRYCAFCVALVSLGALGSVYHLISSASRPSLAAQKFLATTATKREVCTTCVTPGMPFTLSEFTDSTSAPKIGACA